MCYIENLQDEVNATRPLYSKLPFGEAFIVKWEQALTRKCLHRGCGHAASGGDVAQRRRRHQVDL